MRFTSSSLVTMIIGLSDVWVNPINEPKEISNNRFITSLMVLLKQHHHQPVWYGLQRSKTPENPPLITSKCYNMVKFFARVTEQYTHSNILFMIENRRVVLLRVMFSINPSAGWSLPIPCQEKPLQNGNPLPGIDRGAVIVIDKPGWLDHHQRHHHMAYSCHIPHNITGSILL